MAGRRDVLGGLVGLLTFLGGVGVLVATFAWSRAIFERPPSSVLGLAKDKPLDLNAAGNNVTALVIQIVMLLVMCVVGSVIANRGIKLYGASLGPEAERKPGPAPSESGTSENR